MLDKTETTLTCRQVKRWLRDGAQEVGCGGLEGRIRIHLERCPTCAAEWQTLQSAARLAASLPVPTHGSDYWDHLTAKTLARLETEPGPPFPPLPGHWLILPRRLTLAAAGFSAVLLFAAGVLGGRAWFPRTATVVRMEVRPVPTVKEKIVKVPVPVQVPVVQERIVTVTKWRARKIEDRRSKIEDRKSNLQSSISEETSHLAEENPPDSADTVPERVTFEAPTVIPSEWVETERFTYLARPLPEPDLPLPVGRDVENDVQDRVVVAERLGGGLKLPVNRQEILPVVSRP